MDACQTQLFSRTESKRTESLNLGGKLHLIPGFIEEPRQLFEAVKGALSFEERTIVLFGREVLQPRLISWGGTQPYTYSGKTLEPQPIPACVEVVREKINEALKSWEPDVPAFNHVLANLYRDGNDSMGLHADDEPELGADPWIASISLGAERCFQVAPKKKFRERGHPTEKLSLSLPSGSLLLMQPPMQRYYVHGLPKTKRDVAPRLNLTFRAVLQPGESFRLLQERRGT